MTYMEITWLQSRQHFEIELRSTCGICAVLQHCIGLLHEHCRKLSLLPCECVTPSQAPGRLCDFWPTESLWAWVKGRLTKKVSKSKAFKKGVGTRREGRHGGQGFGVL